jgi:hypothetical protein
MSDLVNDALFDELDDMFDRLYIPVQAEEGEFSCQELMQRYPQLETWQQAHRFLKRLLREGWKSKQVRRRSDGKQITVVFKP